MRVLVGLAGTFALTLAALGGGGSMAAADTTINSGSRSLTVSRSADLDPAGADVDVRGSGYDTTKGIYVAFCVDNGPGVAPAPCGGGIDTSGASGSSVWVSSDPPPYGRGLALPYGSGGSFAVTIRVSARIGDSIDCSTARCAIVTRNDHTRSADRGQDLAIPIGFRASSPVPPAALSVLAVAGVVIAGLAGYRVVRRRTGQGVGISADGA